MSSACACTVGVTPALCSGQCVDLASNPSDCGKCTNACPAGDVCTNGVCALVCPKGTTNCANACVNESTDGNDCPAPRGNV